MEMHSSTTKLIRVPASTYEAIKARAQAEDRTLGAVVRRAFHFEEQQVLGAHAGPTPDYQPRQ